MSPYITALKPWLPGLLDNVDHACIKPSPALATIWRGKGDSLSRRSGRRYDVLLPNALQNMVARNFDQGRCPPVPSFHPLQVACRASPTRGFLLFHPEHRWQLYLDHA